jgi:hypothetical protein
LYNRTANEEEIFRECFKHYASDFSLGETWKTLAVRFGFASAEDLRGWFKNQRKKRRIPSKKEAAKATTYKASSGRTNCKILLLDIETTPLLGFFWGLWDQNIPYDRVIQDWHLLCWSAKWLFSPTIMSDKLTSAEAKLHDDKRITISMWNLLNEADVLIAHNGNRFDIKKLNSRFIKHDLVPPTHYQTVDTLLATRSGFGFTSNKLDDLCAYFGFPRKDHTEFSLWMGCFYGDKKALEDMSLYCNNDTAILEEVYLKIRPWIKGHPNLNLWSEEEVSVCPNCGGQITVSGDYYTPISRYDAWRCDDCGAVGRSRSRNIDLEKSKLVVR